MSATSARTPARENVDLQVADAVVVRVAHPGLAAHGAGVAERAVQAQPDRLGDDRPNVEGPVGRLDEHGDARALVMAGECPGPDLDRRSHDGQRWRHGEDREGPAVELEGGGEDRRRRDEQHAQRRERALVGS